MRLVYKIRRWVRILRVFYFGKLTYAKKVRRWINGQLFIDFQELTPKYYEKMVEKYGNQNYITVMEQLSKTNN